MKHPIFWDYVSIISGKSFTEFNGNHCIFCILCLIYTFCILSITMTRLHNYAWSNANRKEIIGNLFELNNNRGLEGGGSPAIVREILVFLTKGTYFFSKFCQVWEGGPKYFWGGRLGEELGMGKSLGGSLIVYQEWLVCK